MFEILLLALTFVCLFLASIEDWKTREVPDYLSYVFIAAAICFRLLWAASDWSLMTLVWIPISFGIFFTFSYLMYRAGQWGGGDVKLMAGLSIALSSFPADGFFPYFLNFFMNVLIAGSLYGIAMILYLGFKNRKKIKLWVIDKALIAFVTIFAIAIIFLFKSNFALMFILLLLGISLGLFKYLKMVEKYCMEAHVPVKNLTEGDWLIKDVKIGKTVVKTRPIGLIEEDLRKLKKLYNQGKIKEVLIKVGIPFIPAFFIAFLLTIMFGNILLRIFTLAL